MEMNVMQIIYFCFFITNLNQCLLITCSPFPTLMMFYTELTIFNNRLLCGVKILSVKSITRFSHTCPFFFLQYGPNANALLKTWNTWNFCRVFYDFLQK